MMNADTPSSQRVVFHAVLTSFVLRPQGSRGWPAGMILQDVRVSLGTCSEKSNRSIWGCLYGNREPQDPPQHPRQRPDGQAERASILFFHLAFDAGTTRQSHTRAQPKSTSLAQVTGREGLGSGRV